MGKKSKQQTQPQAAKPAAADASVKKQEVKKVAVAPQEVAAVPGFFGHVIEPGQKLLWANEVEEFVLQLNSAALGASVRSGRSTLYVLAKESKIALCTLVPETTEQFALAHTFTPLDGEIEFVVEGVNAIHLTGFIDVQEDEDEQDGDDHHDYDDSCDSCDDDHEGHSDDSMDDDEEMMVFGDQSDSDDDDEEGSDDGEDRFEVIEERVHGDAAELKKKATSKDAKKPETPAKKEVTPAKKQDAKKDATPAKKQEAKKEEASPAPTKKEAAAAAKTEKKIAEKVAEVTAAAGKKRPAPSDSVDVPKKAKNSRVYKGVTIEEQAVGKGAAVMKGRKVSILYKGRLENGKQFDANQSRKKPFTFRHGIGDVIKGMDIGIEGMRSGGKRTILIPSKLGYGKAGAGPSIPGNANLIFDIEML